ncbi:MAG: succinate dehydrogenase, cytochrome b556 subunit [Gammaproteobacteria bacterium]|nr:MAG: succinate dehydrogenase, cytochrome b556 subunit [Gammaproteobacteria bacterium]
MIKTDKPVYLDMLHIKLPIAGITSILHRISGLILSLSMVLFVAIFAILISNQNNFNFIQESLFPNLFFKLILVVLLWSFLHHFFAGIRFLLLDFDIGIDKKSGTITAIILFLLSIFSLIFSVWFFIL